MVRTLRLLFLILFVSIGGSVFAQNGFITGKVRDDRNQPAEGAIVKVMLGGVYKGGAAVDEDGNYEVKPLEAGTYDVSVEYTGYSKNTKKGVMVRPNAGVTVDFVLVDNKELKEIEVKYVPKLVDAEKPGTNTLFDAKTIANLPTRSTEAVLKTSTGVTTTKDGGINIAGARSTGTVYIIDGQMISGSRYIDQSPNVIEQMQILMSGVPAKYGDATGGIISITTRGMSPETHGGATLEHSVDGYNNNLASVYLTGPLFSKKDSSGNKRPVLGYMISGDYRYNKDPNPTYQKNYVLRSDLLESLNQNPLMVVGTGANGSQLRQRTDVLSSDDFVLQKARLNASQERMNFNSKLTYQLDDNTQITAGGSYFRTSSDNYNRNYTLFTPQSIANAKSNSTRAYLRFTQRFGKQGFDSSRNSQISNAYYSLQAEYQRDNSTTEDPNHKQDAFKYGYVGKFTENYQPVYSVVQDDSLGQLMVGLVGYQSTNIDFQRAEVNPILANYTSSYYNLGGAVPTNLSNVPSNGTYIRNGDNPNPSGVPGVYSIFNSVGTPFSGYANARAEQFSVNLESSFDLRLGKSKHAIEFGLYYQQRTERNYSMGASSLWGLMRQLTRSAVDPSAVNTADATYIVNGKRYTLQEIRDQNIIVGPNDTVLYGRLTSGTAGRVGGFDYNLKKKLGLDANSYAQIDSYDPSVFSLDMFTPDELLNYGFNRGNYGYDQSGNVITGPVSFNDFFTEKDANGNYTRRVGAYRPNYIAGYISDRVKIGDIIFNLGVRVDRFDNNTKVLKDPYSLYQTYTVGNAPSDAKNNLNDGNPSNMGKDYVVYVANNSTTTKEIIGYRNGDVWYDPYGKEISDPTVLRNYTPSVPEPYLTDAGKVVVTDSAFNPDNSFTDYKPQVNVMPRISFTFPISDNSMFYAHYDVIVQRPRPGLSNILQGAGAYATPVDYYYFTTNTSTIDNPDLKPEKLVDYEVGFQQSISKNSAISINAYYKERRDQIQVRSYLYAYPITYTTYGNRDFSSTKGMSLKYDLRRTNNLQLNLAYTLQFAEGTGSSSTSSSGSQGLLQNLISAQLPNLRFLTPLDFDSRHNISAIIDYRFEKGEGPIVGNSHIFENAGINFLVTARSGNPYTRYQLPNPANVMSGMHATTLINGGINGNRLPWFYMVDLRVDKTFDLNLIGKKARGKGREDGTLSKGKPFSLNAYCYMQNPFNIKIVQGVYGFTGSPTDDGYLTSAQGEVITANQYDPATFKTLYTIKALDPTNYYNPRRIFIGIGLNF